MKHVLPILFSLPTAIILLRFLVGSIFDFAPPNETQEWPPQPRPIPALIVILPIAGFAASEAMMFIRPDDRAWKVATIFNGLPLAFLLLIFTFFWIIGYNG